MPQPVFHLTEDGYFAKESGRFWPAGVNYWPGSCGVELWRAWPAAEIQHDLDVVRSLGLNCVRFFLRWQDFEPQPGRYHRQAFQRLETLLGWCRERDVFAMPSLFVGWMSGGIFWPRWKDNRNLFTDPAMRKRAFAFAGQAARVCARHRETILALDQGNEICCLPDCLDAPPAAVASWCQGVNTAIRRRFPNVLLICGNEQMQVTADTGWRFGAQPGCDLYSMHTYPNSAWHTLAFDGMSDPLAQSLLPFYIKCARAFGPVMAQEFGTLFTRGRGAAAYLRAMLPQAREAGSNGFLWWCLRNIRATCHPYDKNPFEGGMGLVDENDQVKPALRPFLRFALALAGTRAPDRGEAKVSLYWPIHYYHRDNPLNPGNEPAVLSRRLIVAHFALSCLGHRVGIVRGDRPLGPPGGRTIVVAGAALTGTEAAALAAWVRAGGRLIWHGIDAMGFGQDAQVLCGAVPADFLTARAEGVKAFGASWNFHHFPRGVRVGVVPGPARVVARDRKGQPVVLANRLGKGRVAACLAQPDDTFALESGDRTLRLRWLRWYRGMVSLTR